MELKRFIYSLARMFWLIILLGTLGAVGAEFIFSSENVEMYSAETKVFTLNKESNLANTPGSVNYQSILTSRQLASDYQDIVKSERVIAMIAKEINDPELTYTEIKNMIGMSSEQNSNIVVVHAFSQDPEKARKVSIIAAKCFVTALNELTNTNIIGIIDEPKDPILPIFDDSSLLGRLGDKKPLVIGSFIGIVLSLLIIFVIDYFDTTIRFYEDIDHYTDTRVIGVIPKYSSK